MVHIAHLKNQFKSMHTFERSCDYMYIYYKIGQAVQEEKIIEFREIILAILLLFPIVKRNGLSIWKKLNPLHPGMILLSLIEISPVVL